MKRKESKRDEMERMEQEKGKRQRNVEQRQTMPYRMRSPNNGKVEIYFQNDYYYKNYTGSNTDGVKNATTASFLI